jgi:hypothetical protein
MSARTLAELESVIERALISEKFSEKPKRGRPTSFSPTAELMFRQMGIGSECTTRRGKMNRWHAQRAFGVLHGDARFTWLADWEEMHTGNNRARWSILAELGRLRDADTIAIMALRICELKPKTTDAIAMIRRFRLGRKPAGDSEKLFDILARAVDDYRHAHQDATIELCQRACSELWQVLDFLASKECPA